MGYEKQVKHTHYTFQKYFFAARWMSYFYQTKELVTRLDVTTVLDIGPGTVFLRNQLKMYRPDIVYKTVDIAEDVSPDIIGDVTSLPVADYSFDTVCAFQVLEHIVYEDVEKGLMEMARVSKKYVFISVPHFGPSLELLMKIPFLKRLKWAIKIPFPKTQIFNGQHYWELGKRTYSVSRFRKLLGKHFIILDEYIPFENQYHRFFILQKK